MNKQSLKITTGAMATAIFGVFLLLNRQTGNLLQELFLFLYPIPMVAYSAMYGWKSGLPAFVAMSLLSVLFGDFSTIFYAMTQAFIGLVFGGCLYRKVDMTKILFVVMILSALVNVLNIIVLGMITGIGLNEEVAEMQIMMNTVFGQSGVVLPDNMLSTGYLKQILIISMILLGLIEGFIMYELSLQILRRLRFPVQKPKSIYLYAPPKWTGYLGLLAFFSYSMVMRKPLENELLQNTFMSFGVFGFLYLICFGFIGIMLLLKIRFPKLGAFRFVICLLGMFMFPYIEMMVGVLYISGNYRENLVKVL